MKVKGRRMIVIVKEVARAIFRPNQKPARISGRKKRAW
jgi:hypothetical protein